MKTSDVWKPLALILLTAFATGAVTVAFASKVPEIQALSRRMVELEKQQIAIDWRFKRIEEKLDTIIRRMDNRSPTGVVLKDPREWAKVKVEE